MLIHFWCRLFSISTDGTRSYDLHADAYVEHQVGKPRLTLVPIKSLTQELG